MNSLKRRINMECQTTSKVHELFHELISCLKISFIATLLFFPATITFADDFSSSLNFNIPAGAPDFNGNNANGGAADSTHPSVGNDGTSFYELKEGGYWHVIIGEEADGFAYEFYTRAAGVIHVTSGGAGFAYSPDSGGMERSAYNNRDFCQILNTTGGAGGLCGSGADPLNNSNGYDYSGTGTGDGSKMAMRMVMDDGAGMSLEAYKPFTDRKALITQTVIDGDMRSEFVTDMRGLSYNDLSSAAPVSNRQAIDDTTMPFPGAGDFDMSMVQDSNVTAGRFIFTPGGGWTTDAGSGWHGSNSSFDEGVYSYAGGDSFDVLNVPWAQYFDYDQNAGACNAGNRRTTADYNPQDPGSPNDSCPGRP